MLPSFNSVINKQVTRQARCSVADIILNRPSKSTLIKSRAQHVQSEGNRLDSQRSKSRIRSKRCSDLTFQFWLGDARVRGL